MISPIKAPATLETFREVLAALAQPGAPAEVVKQARAVIADADHRVVTVEGANGAGQLALAQRLIPSVAERITARVNELCLVNRLAEIPDGTRFISNSIGETPALPLKEPTRQASRIIHAASVAGTSRTFVQMLVEILQVARDEVPATAAALCAQLPAGPLRTDAEAYVAIATRQVEAEAKEHARYTAALELWAKGGPRAPKEVKPDAPMLAVELPATYAIREDGRAFQLTLLPIHENDHEKSESELAAAVKGLEAAGVPTFIPGQEFATKAAREVATDLSQLRQGVAKRAADAQRAMETAIDTWLKQFGHEV